MSAPCGRLRTLQTAFRFSAITVPMPSSRSGPGWVAVVLAILKGRVGVAGSSYHQLATARHGHDGGVTGTYLPGPTWGGGTWQRRVALGRCNGRCPGVSSAVATSPSVGAAASVSRGHLPLVAASREVLRHCGGRRGHPVPGCPWYERGPGAGTMMSSAFERSHASGENGHCPKRPRGRGSFMATRHRESPG